jgi:hypothetical protein
MVGVRAGRGVASAAPACYICNDTYDKGQYIYGTPSRPDSKHPVSDEGVSGISEVRRQMACEAGRQAVTRRSHPPPSRARAEGEEIVKMATILQFVRKAGVMFDDQLLSIMGKAYDAARQDLHDAGQPDIVYEIIATRIIDAAKRGERDPIRLRDVGLAALGLDGKRTT